MEIENIALRARLAEMTRHARELEEQLEFERSQSVQIRQALERAEYALERSKSRQTDLEESVERCRKQQAGLEELLQTIKQPPRIRALVLAESLVHCPRLCDDVERMLRASAERLRIEAARRYKQLPAAEVHRKLCQTVPKRCWHKDIMVDELAKAVRIASTRAPVQATWVPGVWFQRRHDNRVCLATDVRAVLDLLLPHLHRIGTADTSTVDAEQELCVKLAQHLHRYVIGLELRGDTGAWWWNCVHGTPNS